MTTSIGIVDHTIALILVALIPIFGVWHYRRLVRWVDAGYPGARTSTYRLIIAVEWILALAVIATWFVSGRSAAEIGIDLETGAGWWVGITLTALACALLAVQNKIILKDPEKIDAVSEKLASVRVLLPVTDGESRLFAALSVTAGICEELVYRGYLIAYFSSFLGVWPAAILSSLTFGFGHTYQGPKGVVKTTFIGLLMAGLYLLTGSLWAPMILHAAVDLNSGSLGRRVIQRIESAPQERPVI